MSLRSYIEIVDLINDGVIEGADPDLINPASLDVRLGHDFMFEDLSASPQVIDLAAKETVAMVKRTGPQILAPLEFCLACTQEVFHLPNDIVAEFTLKSSGARNALEHLHAGYCDPGWNNSVLTLELINLLQQSALRLTPGMKIGQMKFYRVTPVPDEHSYSVKGQYNGDRTATSKGIR